MADSKKNQKRRFVRLEVVLPVKFRPYTGNPIFQKNFDLGRTSDLSSGGMSVLVTKPLAPGSKLDMELELDEQVRPYIVGKVLGGSNEKIDGVTRRIEKIDFVDLDQEAQDQIMKFIFESQRKDARKSKK
jgi:c-di-GMP-binding flagellar brake protein YcgR